MKKIALFILLICSIGFGQEKARRFLEGNYTKIGRNEASILKLEKDKFEFNQNIYFCMGDVDSLKDG